jgi:hypothetical protein
VVRHASGIELAFELEGTGDTVPDPGQAVTLALRPQAIRLLEAEPDQKADDEVATEAQHAQRGQVSFNKGSQNDE